VYRGLGAAASDGYLLYSTEAPEDRHDLWTLEPRAFTLPDELRVGDRVQWSLRVNSAVKIERQRHDVGLRAWRRWCDENPDVPHHARPTVEDCARRVVPGWLAPRLDRHGLRVRPEDVVVEAHQRQRFLKDPARPQDRNNDIVVWTADTAGVGVVIDPEALRLAIRSGVGGGRSYGCGLLLVRRS